MPLLEFEAMAGNFPGEVLAPVLGQFEQRFVGIAVLFV